MDNVGSIVNRLGFAMFVSIPPASKWGGILFMWKQELDVELIYGDANIIAMLVYSNIHWLISLVCCPIAKQMK